MPSASIGTNAPVEADHEPQHRAARDRRRRLTPFLAGRQQLAQLRAHDVGRDLAARRRQQFAETEQADRNRHDADAVAELGNAEAEAKVPGHHVDADGAEQKADRGHQQGADQRRGRHVGEEDQAQNEQSGVFRRAEAQRESRERRRDQRQHDDAECAGDEGADRGDAQSRAGAAFLGHGMAVDTRHH